MQNYMKVMYGNTQGYYNVFEFKEANKIRTKFFQKEDIPKVSKYNYHQFNTFISVNTFYGQRRGVKFVKQLNALFVDIDCYAKGLTQGQALVMLKEEFFEIKIPSPTFIVNSGRGLYLIWKLDYTSGKAISRWTATQRFLVNTLAEVGADKNAMDGARILRMPGTLNGKSGTEVKVIEYRDVSFSLYEFMAEYMPSKDVRKKGSATEKQRKYAMDIAAKKGIKTPDFTSFKRTKNWLKKQVPAQTDRNKYKFKESNQKKYEAICQDLEKIYQSRKKEHCKREVACFIYCMLRKQLGWDYEKAIEQTLAFNATFAYPLNPKFLKTRCKSKKYYYYTINRLVEMLEITAEEQVGTLILHESKSNKVKCKEYYDKQLVKNGKLRNGERKKNQQEFLIYGYQNLDFSNKTVKTICDELEISRSTYYRLINLIKAEGIDLCEIKEGLVVMQSVNALDGSAIVIDIAPTKFKTKKKPLKKGKCKLNKTVPKNHTTYYREECNSSEKPHPKYTSMYIEYTNLADPSKKSEVYRMAIPLGMDMDAINKIGAIILGCDSAICLLSQFNFSQNNWKPVKEHIGKKKKWN